MKHLTRILSLVLCAALLCGVSAVASAEQTDFYIMGGMSALSAGYDSNVVLNELQEKAGITIEWDTMSDSLAEQVGIRITGGDLPDAFQAVGFSNYDLSRYGRGGTFIDLGKESMGGGDIKLLSLLALFFSFPEWLLLLLVSCILGLVLAATLGAKKGIAFPFGPAISAAAFLVSLFGSQIAGWYLSLF